MIFKNEGYANALWFHYLRINLVQTMSVRKQPKYFVKFSIHFHCES